MKKDERVFTIGNALFWGLMILVLVFVFLQFNPGLFNRKGLARKIILEDSLSKIEWEKDINMEDSTENDSTKKLAEDYFIRRWSWVSLDGKSYSMKFKVLKQDYFNSINVRIKSTPELEKVWSNMYRHDGQKLTDMINAYKNLIRENNLDYKESLDLVVTSAQNFPYTFVLDDNPHCGENFHGMEIPEKNCTVSENPFGCCDYVAPNGVFSPIEYAVNGTGDCDTKALFAYTILKEMGFDVAMLSGYAGQASGSQTGHAMLGVNISRPPKWSNALFATDFNNNKYFAWETTNKNLDLGEPCWPVWHMEVVKL